MYKFLVSITLLTSYVFPSLAAEKNFFLLSPDERIQVKISTGEQLSYTVSIDNNEILAPSPISLTLSSGKVLGTKTKITRNNQRSIKNTVQPFLENTTEIVDKYNELSLTMAGNYSVVFRAYNNGVAYRFITSIKTRITVKNEGISYNFSDTTKGFFIEVPGFETSYEDNYKYQKISAIDSGKMAILPVLIESNYGQKILITEADLLDYPGTYLIPSEKGLVGVLPEHPKTTKIGGQNNFNRVVTERHDYIAETNGSRSFPWRLMVITRDDKDLLHNHLVYLLSTPSKINDPSWIQPGKVAWDWWNALNLEGVSFKTGFNTKTYKYFIDFASENGLEYVNLDEGWSDQQDLLKVTTQLDMPEVIRYAREKNVKLILWCVWHVLDRQMQEALDQFESWGIAGIKVDFMDRDDQEAVNFYERLAIEAAKRKLVVNFHGAYKPTGLRRTYPNIINREAVMGLEYHKWSNKVTPEHNVTIPFIRMVAGPMDYTPGAMRNAASGNFQPIFEQPMSQGTRCHQLSMFVVYDAPLQMLADAPTAYQKEPQILDFLSEVPTSWDETIPVKGRIGDFLILARRKGTTWYVAAMSDEKERRLNLTLDFIGEGEYDAEIFMDGINAERNGVDYLRKERKIKKGNKISLDISEGGGWVMVIKPAKKDK